jgi:transcriptional regulator GlxA family with amidase domain
VWTSASITAGIDQAPAIIEADFGREIAAPDIGPVWHST